MSLSRSARRLLLLRPSFAQGSSRTFLSAAYACDDAWRGRLNTQSLSALPPQKLDQFFLDADRKLSRSGRGSAIDVDLFANAVARGKEDNSLGDRREETLEQLEELLKKYRRTPQTWNTMDSTYYAVCRAFVDGDKTDKLMSMLADKINFGLFPDNSSLIFLMNHFLLKENFRDAAKVAVHMMLQEELVAPIAKEMAAYSVASFSMVDNAETVWEPLAPPPEEEPEDDVRVRVDYLDSPWTDDHFDLIDKNKQIGKTMTELAKHETDEKVRASMEILGWVLFEKWDRVWKMKGKTVDAKCLEKAKALMEANEGCPRKEEMIKVFDEVKSDSEFDLISMLKSRVEAAVAKHEPDYVKYQTEKFQEWNQERAAELQRQYEMYTREARVEELGRMKADFEEKEKQLFYFDREEEFEVFNEDKIEEFRKKLPPRTWGRKISFQKKEVVSDDYVPPTISRT